MVNERPVRSRRRLPDSALASWLLLAAGLATLACQGGSGRTQWILVCLATQIGGHGIGLVLLPPLAVAAALVWWRSASRWRLLGTVLCLAWLALVAIGGRALSGWAADRRAASLVRERARLEPVLAAVRAYTAEHGRPPEKLESLVPTFLPALPPDHLDDRSLFYDADDGKLDRYRLPGGGELRVWHSGGLVHGAEVTGEKQVPAPAFDPLDWRRARTPEQALAFIELSRDGVSWGSARSMLGVPDQTGPPPEGGWSLRLCDWRAAGDLLLEHVPYERYPSTAGSRRVGRWWFAPD